MEIKNSNLMHKKYFAWPLQQQKRQNLNGSAFFEIENIKTNIINSY
jgi:hypothetical protein